jgi:hypothetical protein
MSREPIQVMTRTEVVDGTACPACGAEPGKPCLGVERRNGTRRQRKRCHAERWEVAAKVRDAARREEVERALEAIASLGARSS